MKMKYIFALFVFCLGQVAMAQTEKEIWIEGANQRIFGVLSKPGNGVERQPLAIIAHGFNGTHHYGKNYFKTLEELGYRCFAFDFPCGSVNSRSDNNTMNMSVIDEQQALETVIDYFRHQSDVDSTRIVLIGESQGGLVSSLVAANPANRIKALILVFPALCIPDNWNARYGRISMIPEVTDLWGVKLGRRFFTELRYLNPYEVIKAYEGPVRIIHGDNDKVVPLDYSRRAATVYKDCRLHVIKDAGHGFSPSEFNESMRIIKEFLSEVK